MQIVINIDEEDYKMLVKCGENVIDLGLLLRLRNLVRESKPLTKGHGRLIDADKLYEEEKRDWLCINNAPFISTDYAHVFAEIDNAPTIIEADTPKIRKGTPLEENDSGYNCENWIP